MSKVEDIAIVNCSLNTLRFYDSPCSPGTPGVVTEFNSLKKVGTLEFHVTICS